MPQNYFIIGEPNAGKTTLLKALIDELKAKGLRVGGIISPEERHHGTRTAFHVMDVESGRFELLASVEGDGPKVSKYHVNVKSFESVAIPVMERFEEYDVFVIDEIGRMEMESHSFARLLDDILESATPLIATLHGEYVSEYASFGEVFELTGNNREAVFTRVLRKARGAFEKKKAKPIVKGKAVKKGNAPVKKKKPVPQKKKAVEKAHVKRGKKAKERPKAAKAEVNKGKAGKKTIIHHLKELFHG